MALTSAWLPISFLRGTLPALPPCCPALGPLPFCLCSMRSSAHWHLCWCKPAVFMFGCWFLRGSLGLVLRSSCRWPLGCIICALWCTMERRCPAGCPTVETGFFWSSSTEGYPTRFAGVGCQLPPLCGAPATGPGRVDLCLLCLQPCPLHSRLVPASY